MKTLEQVKELYKSNTMDGRDLNRLAQFIPFDMLPFCGIESQLGITKEEWEKDTLPFTRDNVIAQLQKDVEFGFEKALNKRGISASFMNDVIVMWNWILEEGLEDYDREANYPQYGLPLLKATALKYGFDNQ